MSTLLANPTDTVTAVDVRLSEDRLLVELSDGRQLAVPYRRVPWLRWLAEAKPEQRADWTLEPGGFAIYWPQLDDGVEVCHLLAMDSPA